MNEPLASPSKNESIKESGNLSMTNHIISANTNNIDHSIIYDQSSQNTDCLNILKGTGTENDLIQNSPEKKKLKTDSSDQKEPSTNNNDNFDQINPDDQALLERTEKALAMQNLSQEFENMSSNEVMLGKRNLYDNGYYSNDNNLDQSNLEYHNSQILQTQDLNSYSKDNSGTLNYLSYINSLEETTPNYVWDYFSKSNKNPIALLNEYCSKEKKNLDFKIEADVVFQGGSNSNKKSVFYTTCIIDGFGTIVGKIPGDSKQASKTNSAKKAVCELINNFETVRLQLLVMLKRIMGVIPKDFKKQDNKKLKKEKVRIYQPDSQELQIPKGLATDPNACINNEILQEELPQQVEGDSNQVQQFMSFFGNEGELAQMSEKFPSESNTSSKNEANGYMQPENISNTKNQVPLTGVQQISMIPNFNSIQEQMDDESKILLVLNAFAQSTKDSLRWRVKSENQLTVAEITIGNLNANAVNTNKRLAKLHAAKNLLKIVDSNTFLKEKFNYFMRDIKHKRYQTYASSASKQNTQICVESPNKPLIKKDPKLEDSTLSIDIKSWFSKQSTNIEPTEDQKQSLKLVFDEVSNLIANMFNNDLKLLPIGSFLNGSFRNKKLEADCILVSQDNLPISLEIIEESVNNIIQLQTDPTVNSYQVSLTKDELGTYEQLTFKHNSSSISVNLYKFNDASTSYKNQSEKSIDKYHSLVFHSVWVNDTLSADGVSQEIIKIMRLVREWREKHDLKVSTEILDLAVYYCTFNFKEFEITKVLMKFFSLLNLLINKYNFYFYELSEYHTYIIERLPEDDRKKVIEKAQETFIRLSNNNPIDFV